VTCVGIRTRRLKDRDAIASLSLIRILPRRSMRKTSRASTVTPMFPDCCRGQNACAHCCARPAGTESRSRTRSRSSDVGRWLETWVDHANRCHCFCAIATVTIMIITWNTREPGNNDDEITREWMCLLRFNECGVGNYL